MSGRLNAKLRNQLFYNDPHCYWCGQLTKLTGGKADPDLATIDHVYSRLDNRRTDDCPKVLACYQCNQVRGKLETQMMRAAWRILAARFHDPYKFGVRKHESD